MSPISSARELTIVYRDDHLLVLEKPVGLATTAPAGGVSLFAFAQALDARAPALHPLSRLDTQVSGLVTFARTPQANRVALDARARGQLRRAYLGIAASLLDPTEGEWSFAIGIDPRDHRRRRALPTGTKGAAVKAARTSYRTHAQAGPLVALDMWPITGRTHQLRVHASAAGAPLLGDVAYGGAKRVTLPDGRVLSAGRTMLHCGAFRMPDPAAPSKRIELALPPPADMRELWRDAGGEPEQLVLRA